LEDTKAEPGSEPGNPAWSQSPRGKGKAEESLPSLLSPFSSHMATWRAMHAWRTKWILRKILEETKNECHNAWAGVGHTTEAGVPSDVLQCSPRYVSVCSKRIHYTRISVWSSFLS
jgi:hypothetical protein